MAKKSKAKTKGKTKSKAESMTGAKENAVEVRELGLGPPVVIESATFHNHMKWIKTATEKKDTANNNLRNCYKAAKAVNEHLPDAIRKVLAAERDNDPVKLKAQLEVLGIALKETGSPVQLTIHDILAESETPEAAYQRGRYDGGNGRTANSGYQKGSEKDESYMTGWRNGTGNNLGLTSKQVDEALEQPAETVN